MIFTPKQPLQLHADLMLLVQFQALYNFAARSILIR
jgi:hypothetical protein